MRVLGAKVDFLGLSDKEDTKEDLMEAMDYYKPDKVWASSGSQKHHQWVEEVARKLWPTCVLYSTYEGENLHVKTSTRIVPTTKEQELKGLALSCYKTQLEKNLPHFKAVEGSEYYV